MKIRKTSLRYQLNVIICGIWFLGLLSGLWISSLSQTGFSQYHDVLLTYRASLSGVFFTVLFPLTTVVIGIIFRLRWLIWLAVFIEAFLYGFSFYYLTCLSGPFFRSIQMFACSLSAFLILIMCFRFYHPNSIRKELVYIFILAILICLLDFLISSSVFFT